MSVASTALLSGFRGRIQSRRVGQSTRRALWAYLFISPFYISSWLSGMVFAEVAERCIKANKPIDNHFPIRKVEIKCKDQRPMWNHTKKAIKLEGYTF